MRSEGERIAYEWINIWLKANHHVFKSNYQILINTRPKFLKGLELDFYLPELKLAFEFQGEQHYDISREYSSTFQKFGRQIFNDIQKDILCRDKSVLLIRLRASSLVNYHSFKGTIKHSLTDLTKDTHPLIHKACEGPHHCNGCRKLVEIIRLQAKIGYDYVQRTIKCGGKYTLVSSLSFYNIIFKKLTQLNLEGLNIGHYLLNRTKYKPHQLLEHASKINF